MKTTNLALRVAGTIFGIVAILHLLRIITCVPVVISNWDMPLWFNWMGLIGAGFLCGWLWTVSFRKE